MELILVTCSFLVADVISGALLGWFKKDFSSSKMREGIFHKGGELLFLLFGILIDFANVKAVLQIPFDVIPFICIYTIVMESVSVLENIGKINPKIVPKTIRKHFKALEENYETEEEE